MTISLFSISRPKFLQRPRAKKSSAVVSTLMEVTPQVRYPHGIPMMIDVSIEKAAASQRVSLKYERQNIYYLRTSNPQEVCTSTSDAVLMDAKKGGRHKRSATLETLGTNYSGGAYEDVDDILSQAIPNIDFTTKKNKQGSPSIFSRSTTHSANSDANDSNSNNSNNSDDEYYLVLVEKELDQFIATRGDKLSEDDIQILFMNQVTKYVMEEHDKKKQERRSLSWFARFCASFS